LEYKDGEWSIYHFDYQEFKKEKTNESEKEEIEPSNNLLFDSLLQEFNMLN
jgi:hypothetical protein